MDALRQGGAYQGRLLPWGLAAATWAGLAVFIGYAMLDFAQRVSASDPVAVAFAEGGDDAYYYFTIARNVAAGLGITVDGVHWTSGFQPLWLLPSAVAFLAHSDRAALAIMYVFSVALWLSSAMLFVMFLRRAVRPLGPVEVALLAALFLCERQLNIQYVNGMDTGLYCTLVLLLLLGFQSYFASSSPSFDGRGAVRLGFLSGLLLLARNDGVFLCGALGLLVLFASGRPHRLREMLTAGAVAVILVVPWLAYCQWVAGVPMPQSGVATSAATRPVSMSEFAWTHFAVSVWPVLVSRVQQVIDNHWILSSILGAVAAVGLVVATLRPQAGIFNRASRLVLVALVASTLMLLVYYAVISSAVQFYVRYFVPAKLLVLLLGAGLLLRLAQQGTARAWIAGAALAVAAIAVASNLYWVSLRMGRPYDGYFGREAYDLSRSPVMADAKRVGMLESGRIGFLYPTRVMNLDGKMNVDALKAIRAGTLGEYIDQQAFDLVMLHDFDVKWLDERFATWRRRYEEAGTLGTLFLFRRKASP